MAKQLVNSFVGSWDSSLPFRKHITTSSTSFSRPFWLSRETGIEPNLSYNGNIIVDRLDTFLPHPIKGAFDLSCTVVYFLFILLWNQLVHLLEITCWIKGLVHGVAPPRRNVIDVLLPFFGTSRDLGKGTIQTRLETNGEAACKFFLLDHGIHPCYFANISQRHQHHSVDLFDRVEKLEASPTYRMTGNILVDRLDTFVLHPIKGALDISWTVV